MSLTNWKVFERVQNAKVIAASLKEIPSHWSLTEAFIPHELIASLIIKGEQATSKRTGKSYRRYWSGYGLRTGSASGDLVAIDCDGNSAQLILAAISGDDTPQTVSCTSGKPGRYQLLYQVPANVAALLQNFTRRVITQWQGLETAKDESGKPTEGLEFRYNRCQSALPPSRHPSTGFYKWINSPATTNVAIAPDWLCNLLLKFASEEERHVTETSERIQIAKTLQQKRNLTPISTSNGNLRELLDLKMFLTGVVTTGQFKGVMNGQVIALATTPKVEPLSNLIPIHSNGIVSGVKLAVTLLSTAILLTAAMELQKAKTLLR